MNKNRRCVLRFALYIDRMGAVPTGYQGQSLAAYAVELQHQYEELRQELGPETSAWARTAGRELIRTEGFAEIQTMLETAGSLSLGSSRAKGPIDEHALPMSCPVRNLACNERLLRRAASSCHRKLRHVDFLSAMLHARRLEDPYMSIYPCPICLGLHVGHRQDAQARRRRSIVKELESLERRMLELKRSYAGLLDRRDKLVEELEAMESTDLL